MPRRRSGKLNRYGDLMVRSAAGCGNRAARREVTSRRCRVVRGARPDSWMTQRVEKRRYGRVRQSRPLSVVADEERTYRCGNRCR